MPIGYLVTTTLVALCALAAVASPKAATTRRFRWWRVLIGTVNELPFVAAYWLVVSSGLAAAQGDLSTPVGLIGFVAAVAAMAALVVIARRGLAARSVLLATLDDTFVVPERDSTCRMSKHHRWWRILVAPLSFRGRGVLRDGNVSYGPAGRRNLLDVYHHAAHEGRPVLVYFHGGGFHSGHKNREAKPLLHRLARRGWVCVSANYRLAPEARFHDQLVDAKRVIAWARRNADRYGGDPSSPHAYIHGDAPPMFIAHGDRDTVVPINDARVFADELGAVSSKPVLFAELPGAQHGFDIFRSPRFEAVVDAIEAFVAAVR
jgi:acetyl esterase/lipase